jgi:murein DD-endopeptidase MepM/ murein hydrolase activator NlpD
MTERSVREMQDEIARLLASFGAMKDTLLETFSALGLEPPSLPPETADTDEIHRLSLYLAGSARRLSELGAALEFRNAILAEIPSIWPVKGGGGYLTAAFGAAVHPISGQRYLHRGIDISTRRQGDPLVATANGEIVTAEFDLKGGFGNTIVIRHANGFYSRYSHMLSFLVKTGQKVKQGEVIGFIGNTGLSTGPHLHYEIHWGSALVDPLKYIYRPYSPPPPGPAKPANLAEAERPARKAIPAAAYQ